MTFHQKMLTQIVFISVYGHTWHPSFLYIGPGMDGGTISLIVAFLVSFFTFLISVIWYPIKKMVYFFKKITGKIPPQNPGREDTAGVNSATEENA